MILLDGCSCLSFLVLQSFFPFGRRGLWEMWLLSTLFSSHVLYYVFWIFLIGLWYVGDIHTKMGNWKPPDKSGVYVFSFTASFNTQTCCESRGWKFTSTKQVGHLGFISSPGVVFLDVSRNHWWLGWVMIHHATIMPLPLVELKKPVRKFWWNKFKQHSREVWCNWPGKHPWREFLGKKCQLLRWVGKIEPHHIAWDLRLMT